MAALTEAVFAIDARTGLVNLGTGGAALNPTSGLTSGADSNDPTYLAHTGTNYVYLPGGANVISVPDAAALDITGDIDIRACLAADDWTPTAAQAIVTKYGGAGSRSYYLRLDTAGTLSLLTSADGTAVNTFTSTVATGVADGATKWVRATLDVDNGASGKTATFFLSDDGSTWTQLGTAVTNAGTTSIFNSTTNLQVGTVGTATDPLAARVFRAQVFNGIGGAIVADIDTSAITSGAQTSFTATTGQTVTINRSTSGKKAVAVTRPCWVFGTDDYLEVADNALLDFGASDSFTVLAAVRRTGTLTNFNTILAKRDDVSAASTNPGYGWRANADGRFYFAAGGSSTPRSASSPVATVNTLSVVASVHSPSSTTTYLGGTAGTAVTTPAAADMSNARSLFIGRGAVTGEYGDFELFAVAIWRRALSAAEIAEMSTALTNAVLRPTVPDELALTLNTQPGDLLLASQPNDVVLHTTPKGLVLE